MSAHRRHGGRAPNKRELGLGDPVKTMGLVRFAVGTKISQRMKAKAAAVGAMRRELAGKVRMACHELLAGDEIQALLENRLRDELRGNIEKGDNLRIAPTMLRIAAETETPRLDPVGGNGTGQHVHFHGWSPKDLLEYARTGKRPQLPEAKTP